jgi:hypothetical protein
VTSTGAELVAPHQQAGPRRHAPGRHDDLGGSVERTARGSQQLGGGEPAEHAPAVEQQVGGSRAHLEGDLGVGADVDPGEQAAEPRAAQRLGGDEPGGDGSRAAEGVAQIDRHARH